MSSDALNFDRLVSAIAHAHDALVEQAAKAVNISLTLRNWLIGYYIRECEQSGADRGAYGEKLLEALAERLHQGGLQRVQARELRRFRQFYLAYPEIRETLSAELPGIAIRETVSPESQTDGVPAHVLLERLSFSHFAALLQLDDSQQRSLYEVEAMEYALAGMSNQPFVSRYQVQLPGKEEIAAFLDKAVEELGGGYE